MHVKLRSSQTVLSNLFLIWVSKHFASIKKIKLKQITLKEVTGRKLLLNVLKVKNSIFTFLSFFQTFVVKLFLLRLLRIRNQNQILHFFVPIFCHISRQRVKKSYKFFFKSVSVYNIFYYQRLMITKLLKLLCPNIQVHPVQFVHDTM
jgi:hypothetical protein